MSVERFEETSRDILVELRADMRHVRKSIDQFQVSDNRQWEKLDEHGAKIAGHDRSIGFLSWGVRLLVGGVVTVIGGIIIYVATH